jgi:hypothetical protein
MKAATKKGKIEVTIQYSDYALASIERAANMLDMTPIHVCVAAHRLMIDMADKEPALFAQMMKHFCDGLTCETAN